jgi:hypothetical protein
MRTDFTITGDGPTTTVYLLTPHTSAAHEWVAENLPDDATFFGGGIAVEHHFIGDIAAGIVNTGLSIA